MRIRMLLLACVIAAGTAVAALNIAAAQDMQSHMGSGMTPGGGDRQPTEHGMMQGGSMGQGMMCPMMRSGMMQGGMMREGMMGSEMMSPGMMQGGRARSGMAALFGSRVRPVMNISVDDVRGYLTLQLQRLNNKRLKLGDIKSSDGAITADIVTIDNSLVQRLKVDPHTGAITYED